MTKTWIVIHHIVVWLIEGIKTSKLTWSCCAMEPRIPLTLHSDPWPCPHTSMKSVRVKISVFRLLAPQWSWSNGSLNSCRRIWGDKVQSDVRHLFTLISPVLYMKERIWRVYLMNQEDWDGRKTQMFSRPEKIHFLSTFSRIQRSDWKKIKNILIIEPIIISFRCIF